MKRYSMILIALIGLSALAYDYQITNGQQPGTRRDVTSSAKTPAITETPKGKVLVEKLPEDVEGVVLEKGAVKAKPGYKFVKKDNRVMVMKIGSAGVADTGGSWVCLCKSTKGSCIVYVTDNRLECARDDCDGECNLGVVVRKVRTAIIQY
jgi:hypothetical protein